MSSYLYISVSFLWAPRLIQRKSHWEDCSDPFRINLPFMLICWDWV